MLQTQVCPKCNGRKFVNGNTCLHCNGTGEISTHKKFTVKIPAEIKDQSKIRLSGEGLAGTNGGKNGDLYITINIKEEKLYSQSGLNIYKTVKISPIEAVLGSTLIINTPNGKVSTKISAGTENGQKIRLSKCGLVQNNKIGDMIITIEIQIPKNLSTKELELYRQLREISGNNMREV
jgi:molecular chaperone DnaJ